MSPRSDDDLSLINDSESFACSERLEQPDEIGPAPEPVERVDDDPFAAIDEGLGPDDPTLPLDVPAYTPFDDPRDPQGDAFPPIGRQVPLIAAALVVLACLTVGAATAAVIFYDRVTQITAPRAATR